MTSSPAGEEPVAAAELFGDRVQLARRYAALLAGEGIRRGLLGPREADRLWDRHLLNSAVLVELLPLGARVVDVGAGAGLPGIPMALARPDLRVDLVEPMSRRVAFLTEVVAELELGDRVRVFRGRADEPAIVKSAGGTDWVVARAVAPLDRLVRWCLALLRPGGRLLALKGESAAAEVAEHERSIQEAGAEVKAVQTVGADLLPAPSRVVVVERLRRRGGRKTA